MENRNFEWHGIEAGANHFPMQMGSLKNGIELFNFIDCIQDREYTHSHCCTTMHKNAYQLV